MKKILSIILFLVIVFGCSVKETETIETSTSNFTGETITVKGGTFSMGSNDGNDDEKPIHTVKVGSFSISKYEITNTQYATFMNAINANANGSVNGIEYLDMDSNDIEITYTSGNFFANTEKENHPVMLVTWYGAKAYCEYYGGRLPTEAEWEFAARGGNNSNGYIYAGSNILSEVAYYDTTTVLGVINTGNVGTKNPNELGLYDMSGNVSEWTNDYYSYSYYENSPIDNPQGPSAGTPRVTRGGYRTFSSGTRCRVAWRGNSHGRNKSVGFRPVFIP